MKPKNVMGLAQSPKRGSDADEKSRSHLAQSTRISKCLLHDSDMAAGPHSEMDVQVDYASANDYSGMGAQVDYAGANAHDDKELRDAFDFGAGRIQQTKAAPSPVPEPQRTVTLK